MGMGIPEKQSHGNMKSVKSNILWAFGQDYKKYIYICKKNCEVWIVKLT
jgi:hypothetical protein